MADIEIEIDGRKLTARPEQTVIQVADEAGIYIPRFCYHKHLSIPANCRMCIVEVEKSPKPLPACATPVLPGMKVFTKSHKTILAQRAVMEFLLINHPLDCPICDQGGECELQDLSMGYGSSHSDYNECKRSVADQNLGPLISTEMTRCIACTRCVRFGEDVAGLRELGALYRGENTEISTYIKHVIKSEVSGNIIDLCPVGALTSKPYRFTARAWELDQAPSISPHDCYGSNLNVHTRYGKVMRVVSRENVDINQTWISDRDRFSYTGLCHADRIDKPLVKINDEWRTVDWKHAFEVITKNLQEIIHQDGAEQIGALASPNSTTEEFYLLQKLMHGLGSPHVDHRLREIDTQDQASLPLYPGFAMSFSELEQCDAIVIIGSNLQKELPLAALRVRKAAQKNAIIVVINPVDYHFNFSVTHKSIIAPQSFSEVLTALVQAFSAPSTNIDENIKSIFQSLQGKQRVAVLLGELVLHHPQAAIIRYHAKQLVKLTNAKLNHITDGANSAGAWLAGAIPHRHAAGVISDPAGLSAYQMLINPRKAYLLLNIEPSLDTANAAVAVAALKQAKFTIALSAYSNSILQNYAHVILPITPFTETSGTYINATGVWQSFKGVAKAFGDSRPAWKVLRVLGNFLHLDGFGYNSSEEINHELYALVERKLPMTLQEFIPEKEVTSTDKINRIGEIPIYATDALVRRATPLQHIQPYVQGQLNVVRLHPQTAIQLQLNEGDLANIKQQNAEVQLPVSIDEKIAMNAAWIPGGVAATDALGDLIGEIEIHKR